MATEEQLDDFIRAAATLLELTVQPDWMPAVRSNLAITLQFAALVAAFPLPDDAEPSPVFKA